MRILVVSDTHGKRDRLSRAILAQSKAEVVIHLGDCISDIDLIRYEFPEKMFTGVAGNCDFGRTEFYQDMITLDGKKIFYTHGHKFGVKGGHGVLVEYARRQGADICLFGHTHVPVTSYQDGLYVMNPGSLGEPRNGLPTYGIIDIVRGGVVTNIVEMKKV